MDVILTKKIISVILICVLCFTAIPVVSFADSVTTDDTPLGVIVDAEGNIVEFLTMTRGKYVDGTFTIPAGGYLNTLQYQPTKNFAFGLEITDDDDNLVTTLGCKVSMTLYLSKTIGGGNREPTIFKQFTTTYSGYRILDAVYITANENFIKENSEYPYYNGRYDNLSQDKDLTLRIVIYMDE